MSIRRGYLELFRDFLLILEMEGQPMKRTPLMYGVGMSWQPFNRMLLDMEAKGLIEFIDPFEWRARSGKGRFRRKAVDRRTKVLVGVTIKGQWVLRWLDQMLRYISDESSSARPPLWVLQTLFRGRIEDIRGDAPDPFTVLRKPMEIQLPGLAFKLTPPREHASMDLPVKFVVAQYRVIETAHLDLAAAFRVKPYLGPKVMPIPQEWIIHKAYQDLGAEFKVMHLDRPLFCPECGKKCKNFHGLKIHVGSKHWRKKKEILDAVKLLLRLGRN